MILVILRVILVGGVNPNPSPNPNPNPNRNIKSYRVGLSIPHIAAGDNLLLAAVGRLLRGSGAFFIKRGSTPDAMYSAVLDDYLSAIMKRGYNMEFFIEGGRWANHSEYR